MEPTKNDCMVMYNALSAIVQPAFADIKDLDDREEYIFHIEFVYAIAYNKRKLKDIVDALQEAQKTSDEYNDYLEERDKVLQRFAVKLDDGSPKERIDRLSTGQVINRSYIVPDLAEPTSKASKEIKALEEKHKDLIDIRKNQTADFEKLVKEKVGDDIGLKLVRWSMIPKGLQPQWMDGVMYMIDLDSKEPGEEIKPDKKKK